MKLLITAHSAECCPVECHCESRVHWRCPDDPHGKVDRAILSHGNPLVTGIVILRDIVITEILPVIVVDMNGAHPTLGTLEPLTISIKNKTGTHTTGDLNET
jgi:hypothetical protein